MSEMTPTNISDSDKKWQKYDCYNLEVDPNQDDRAKRIKILSFSRPHMRAFHCSWWGYFMAFNMWFAISPLQSEIQKSLQITNEQLWTASIAGVGGTIFMRFLLGPLCDKYGPRTLMACLLCFASIPTALTGMVNSATELTILRLFIGTVGGTFVMCQYWTSRMFTREVVGTANAMAGGWGNLGGGFTQLLVGSILFPLFEWFFSNSENPADMAWRTVCIVPAIVAFISGIAIFKFTEDAPKGDYHQLKAQGLMVEVSAITSFGSGFTNINTWLIFIQYACCFGVELTMNNAAALYFRDEFGLETETAAAIASIFGWMNLFARGLGGFLSDAANTRIGMRGRLLVQSTFLLLEGLLILLFANTKSLSGAIAVMVFFSLFVQAAEGSSYGIVPYIDPRFTGSISGIVGAGGNVGAVCFSLAFRQLDYYNAFVIMAACIIAASFLSVFVFIKGQSSVFYGKEERKEKSQAYADNSDTSHSFSSKEEENSSSDSLSRKYPGSPSSNTTDESFNSNSESFSSVEA